MTDITPNTKICDRILCKYSITRDGDDKQSYKMAIRDLFARLRKEKYNGNGNDAQNDPDYKSLVQCVGFFDNDINRFPTQRDCKGPNSTPNNNNNTKKNKPSKPNNADFDDMKQDLILFDNSIGPIHKALLGMDVDYKWSIKYLKEFRDKLSKYPNYEFDAYIDNVLDNVESDVSDLITFKKNFYSNMKLYDYMDIDIIREFNKFINSNPTRISTPRASPPKTPKTPPRASPPRASPGSNKKTQKRCPKGYHRNKKTGNCDPV
jgi:hypothetical protein